MCIAIIVPVLNEAENISSLAQHLQIFIQQGAHVFLVDGDSNDQTVHLAKKAGLNIINAPRGRASQMNAGADATTEDILLFLHADTRLPEDAIQQITTALVNPHTQHHKKWGRFNVRITGSAFMLSIIARMMNLRSKLTGIATGDQAIFIQRKIFSQLGGFPDQPLMEDIEISKKLRRLCAPACISSPVQTSGRRWEQRGVWKTIFLMWKLRWQYWRGTSAFQLAKKYH